MFGSVIHPRLDEARAGRQDIAGSKHIPFIISGKGPNNPFTISGKYLYNPFIISSKSLNNPTNTRVQKGIVNN